MTWTVGVSGASTAVAKRQVRSPIDRRQDALVATKGLIKIIIQSRLFPPTMHGAVFQRELGGISALSAGKYIETFSSNENRTPGGRSGYWISCCLFLQF